MKILKAEHLGMCFGVRDAIALAREESARQPVTILGQLVHNPTVLERLRTEDEKHLIEIEKRYFGKLQFRKEPAMHAEQFKIVNVANNEELASVGG